MSNPVYTSLTVNEDIFFPSYSTTSSILIEKTMGLTRNSTNYLTSLPFDTFQVSKGIISLTKLQAPICNISNLLTTQDATITGTLNTTNLTLSNTLTAANATFSASVSISALSVGDDANFFCDTIFTSNIYSQGNLYLSNPLSMTGTNTNRSINGCCTYNITPASLSGSGSKIYHTSPTCFIENQVSTSDIQFIVRNSSNTPLTTLRSESDLMSISTDLLLNSSTANKRQFYGCYLNLVNITNLTEIQAGRLYSTGGQLYLQNLKTSGNTIFTTLNDVGATVFPLTLTPTQLTVGDKIDITQTSNILDTDTSRNVLKRTFIRIKSANSAVGTATTAFEIYDDNPPNDRGFLFMPNCAGGALNGIVQANDSVISGRRLNNLMAMTLTLWSSTPCGVRLACTSASTASVTIKASTNEIVVSENITTPITFNNRISFTDGSSSKRRIDKISVLSLRDTQGTGDGALTEMYISSITSSVNYVCYQDNYSHIFYTSTSGSQSTKFTIAPTLIGIKAPIDSTAATPTASNHTGYINHSANPPVSLPNSSTIGPIGNFVIPSKGVYSIHFSIKLINLDGTNGGSIDDFLFGINKSPSGGPANTTSILGGAYSSAQYRIRDLDGYMAIFPSSDWRVSTSCVIAADAGDTIYMNGYLAYYFSALMNVQVIPTWVKIL